MKAVITLLAIVSFASSVAAGERCPAAPPPHNALTALGDVFSGFAAGSSPAIHEQQMQQKQMQATYEALLAAGAPESLACAAALNPEILRTIAPTYFAHPSR
jgi:hypothetical protein